MMEMLCWIGLGILALYGTLSVLTIGALIEKLDMLEAVINRAIEDLEDETDELRSRARRDNK